MVLPTDALQRGLTLLDPRRVVARCIRPPSTTPHPHLAADGPPDPARQDEPDELVALRARLAEPPAADGPAQAARARRAMVSYLDARRRRLRRELDQRRAG